MPVGNTAPIPRGHGASNSISVIGAGMKISGNLDSDDDVEIGGRVEGDVRSRAVTVSEGAHVEGAIVAATVTISGFVKGHVRAPVVRIAKTGQVFGDVTYQTLFVDEGAVFEGSCRRLEAEKGVRNAAAGVQELKSAAPAIKPVVDAAAKIS